MSIVLNKQESRGLCWTGETSPLNSFIVPFSVSWFLLCPWMKIQASLTTLLDSLWS